MDQGPYFLRWENEKKRKKQILDWLYDGTSQPVVYIID